MQRDSTARSDDRPKDDVATLQAEIVRLRDALKRLQLKYDELLRSVNARDYEKPPHYR